MRTIKFRAWCTRDREKGEMLTNPFYSYEDGTLSGRDSSDILMQFTGLLDKKGVEIYEGDILEYNDKESITENFVEPVSWNEEQGYFCTESSEHVWGEVARLSKIVGNIYENQELLEIK